jgi:uncharacterized protein (TIGR02145 family)
MTKNLDVATFRNGDPIPEAKTNEEWLQAGIEGKPAWCYYNNDPKNGTKYGKHYNWYAANDSRGLAPVGWHVPSNEEWALLSDYLGGKVAGKKLKNTNGWHENGTNSSGFSGLPGGRRDDLGTFISILGYDGHWWSSTGDWSGYAIRYTLFYNNGNLFSYNCEKGYGCSVRCLRD